MKAERISIKSWILPLMAAGALALAACGGKNDPELIAPGQSAVEEDLPAEKRYVYEVQEIGMEQDAAGALTTACEKEGVYYFLENARQTVTPDEAAQAFWLHAVTLDEAAAPRSILLEGNVPEDDRITAAKAAVENAVSTYETVRLEQVRVDEQGNIWGVLSYTFSSYADAEHFSSFRGGFVRHWNADGKLLWESPLDAEAEDGALRVNALSCTQDGGATVLVSGDRVGKYTVKEEGTVSELLSAGDYSDAFLNPYKVLYGKGNLLWILYEDSVSQGYYLLSYDIETEEIGERVVLSDQLDWNHILQIAMEEDGNLIYSDGEGIYSYNVAQGTITTKMDFFNSDLDIGGLDSLFLTEKGFLVSYRSRNTDVNAQDTAEQSVVSFLTKKDGSQIPDKNLIQIGGFYLDSELKSRMIRYNVEHETSRMIFKSYGTYDRAADGYAALKDDLRNGNGPDILVVDSYVMELPELVREGFLTSLDEWLKEDETLSGEDYLDNIWDACRIDGKLYEIIPEFGIETYIGKESLYSGQLAWTTEELEAVQQSVLQSMASGDGLSQEVVLLDEYDFKNFCSQLLAFDGGCFIDEAAGSCSFNSEEFVALLKYAKSLEDARQEHTAENTGWWAEYASRYRDGRVLLEQLTIGDPGDILSGELQEKYGEAVGFPGLPTDSDCGSVIRTGTTYAIVEKSEAKEEAWEFLKFYLTGEYQCRTALLPVSKEAWNSRLEACSQSDSLLEPEAWETQKELLEKLVTAVDRRVLENRELDEIFDRELEDFCAGKKKASDTAYILQTRVNRHLGGLKE